VIGVAVFKNGPFRLLYNQVAQQWISFLWKGRCSTGLQPIRPKV
jgi:hypothetical protein